MHCATQRFALLFRLSLDDPPPRTRAPRPSAVVTCGDAGILERFVFSTSTTPPQPPTPHPPQEVKSNITILLLQREQFLKRIIVQISELEMPAPPVHQSHKIRCRLIFLSALRIESCRTDSPPAGRRRPVETGPVLNRTRAGMLMLIYGRAGSCSCFDVPLISVRRV